jgi:TPR repeat protein
MAILVVALAFVGCGGGAENEEIPEVPVQHGGEEDAYQTAVFAQQRAEWEAQAEQGDSKAQRQLGMMYYLGQGLETDYAMAHEWLGKAAAQGDDIAQLTLGVMHVEGQGVEQDNVAAYMWFSLSLQQGNPSAQIRLDRLESDMSEEEIAEAQQRAEEWTPSS